MAEEITITIHKDHLRSGDRVFGIADDDFKLIDDKGNETVKIFINNKLTEAVVTKGSIVIKAPSPRPTKAPPRSAQDTLTVVVTTKQDKIIKILKFKYAPKEKKFKEPLSQSRHAGPASATSEDSGSDLINAIGEAAQKIAEAMTHPSTPSDSDKPIKGR
jgi:hypothetical protein